MTAKLKWCEEESSAWERRKYNIRRCSEWIDQLLDKCIHRCDDSGDDDGAGGGFQDSDQGGSDMDGGASEECNDVCTSRMSTKLKWCESRPVQASWVRKRSGVEDCHSWGQAWLKKCVARCKDESKSRDDEEDQGGPKSHDNDDESSCSCKKHKAEKFQWCKGLNGQKRAKFSIDTCTPFVNNWYDTCVKWCNDGSNSDDDDGKRKDKGGSSDGKEDSDRPTQMKNNRAYENKKSGTDKTEGKVADGDGKDGNRNAGKKKFEIDDSLSCRANCKDDVKAKESWCRNKSTKDERKKAGVPDGDCSKWIDKLRNKCYDRCYDTDKIVEAESIKDEVGSQKVANDEPSGAVKEKNQKNAKPAPEKAEKKKRQDDAAAIKDSVAKDQTKKQDTQPSPHKQGNTKPTDSTHYPKDESQQARPPREKPWIDSKVPVQTPALESSSSSLDEDNAAGGHLVKPSHPHIPGLELSTSSSFDEPQRPSRPVDIRPNDNDRDIDSFSIDLSVAVRANNKPETIKIRSNSATAKVQADQESVRSRFIIQE